MTASPERDDPGVTPVAVTPPGGAVGRPVTAGPGTDTASPASAPLPSGPPPRGILRAVPPALAVPTFRWYWAAQWPVLVAGWMEIVALGYLVYAVSHSQAAVALVAAADGLPAVVVPVLGGALADRLPRRRILLVTQSLLALSAGALGLAALGGIATVPLITAVAVVFGAADSLDLPTRQALVADLVDRETVVNAVALGSTAMSASRILGPALGGVLIAAHGPAVCFLALALAYTVPLAVLVLVIPDIPPAAGAPQSALRGAWGGIRAAWGDPLVRRVLLCTSVLALLGVSYMPFLPVLARDQLGGDSRALGVLYSTGGIGGLVAGLGVTLAGRGVRRRTLLRMGGGAYAAGLFGLTRCHSIAPALPALLLLSFGFLCIATALTTLLQTDTPPEMRGRLLGLNATAMAGLQPLGTLAYGALGGVLPLFDVIGVGGICVGVAAILTASSGALAGIDGGGDNRGRHGSRASRTGLV